MSVQLRPAHDVIVERIIAYCSVLKAIESGEKVSESVAITAFIRTSGRAQEIGGLCGLCDVLQLIVIPIDQLPAIIDQLRKVKYSHAVLENTINQLSERQAAA